MISNLAALVISLLPPPSRSPAPQKGVKCQALREVVLAYFLYIAKCDFTVFYLKFM